MKSRYLTPQDLKHFFEVVGIQPKIDEGRTVAFSKIKKYLRIIHPDKGAFHPDKSGDEEYKKLLDDRPIIEFIYCPWSEYDDNEKRIFIEFLAMTSDEDIVKGILQYKIKKGICGLSNIEKDLADIATRRQGEPGKQKPYNNLKNIVRKLKQEPDFFEEKPQPARQRKESFNFTRDSYEEIRDSGERISFLQQLLKLDHSNQNKALLAQMTLNLNNIPHLFLSLQTGVTGFPLSLLVSH